MLEKDIISYKKCENEDKKMGFLSDYDNNPSDEFIKFLLNEFDNEEDEFFHRFFLIHLNLVRKI